MSNSKAVVVVIDDDQMVLEALQSSISSLGITVQTFLEPAPCIKFLKNERCNLLLTDVNMPELNGIDLVKRARELQPFLPIIVMTGYADIPTAVRAVKAGALEFIEKPLDEDTLLPLIKRNLLLEAGDNEEYLKALTKTERDVLKLVAEGKSNKEIAYLLDKSIRTVENQRHRLGKKLNVNSAADMARLAIQIGLIKL